MMTVLSKNNVHPFSIALGVYDAPERQAQPVFYLDYFRNNVLVFGGPMTGKTTLVKTFLSHLHKQKNRMPREDVYIIDFGGNIDEYARLGSVCACFDQTNEENIKRVFRRLEDRLTQNVDLLGGKSFYTKALKAPDKCPPHITLIIENINTFLSDERYEHYQDKLIHLCRDGLSKGLSVIMTANDLTGTSRLLANCGQKITFDMPSDHYFDIFNTKVLKPMRLPGRGVANLQSETYEFQCFLPFVDEAELTQLIKETASMPNENRMLSFDGELTRQNVAAQCAMGCSVETNRDSILVGLEYYQHKPVVYDFRACPVLAIYGKRNFGIPNLLHLLLHGFNEKLSNARYIYLDDGRGMLKPYYEQDLEQRRDSWYCTNLSMLRRHLLEQGYIGQKQLEHVPYGSVRAMRPEAQTMGQNPFGLPQIPGLSPLPRESGPTVLPAITEQQRLEPADVHAGQQYTVFVLQGKSLYHNAGSPDGRALLTNHFPELISLAEEKGYVFIFSDVKTIADADVRSTFNNYVSSVFLLDDIGDFISEKGNKSPLGEMNAKELRAEYAKCVQGDAFYYDIGADTLEKLRIIKMQ